MVHVGHKFRVAPIYSGGARSSGRDRYVRNGGEFFHSHASCVEDSRGLRATENRVMLPRAGDVADEGVMEGRLLGERQSCWSLLMGSIACRGRAPPLPDSLAVRRRRGLLRNEVARRRYPAVVAFSPCAASSWSCVVGKRTQGGTPRRDFAKEGAALFRRYRRFPLLRTTELSGGPIGCSSVLGDNGVVGSLLVGPLLLHFPLVREAVGAEAGGRRRY